MLQINYDFSLFYSNKFSVLNLKLMCQNFVHLSLSGWRVVNFIRIHAHIRQLRINYWIEYIKRKKNLQGMISTKY